MATLAAWKRAGLFLQYHGKDWVAERGDPLAWEVVQAYIKDLEQNFADGRGIIFMGGAGKGKTHLAHVVANAALDAMEGSKVRLGYRVRAFSVQSYMDLFRQQMDALTLARKGSVDDLTGQYEGAEELVTNSLGKNRFFLLDDLGKEHVTATGFAQQKIEHLLRERRNRCLPTLLTTNVESLSALAALYDESFASHVVECCVQVPVLGEDYRRNFLAT